MKTDGEIRKTFFFINLFFLMRAHRASRVLEWLQIFLVVVVCDSQFNCSTPIKTDHALHEQMDLSFVFEALTCQIVSEKKSKFQQG